MACGRVPTDRPSTVRPRQPGVASGAAAGSMGTQRLSELIERVIRRVGIADRGGRIAAELRSEMESYWATTPVDPMVVLTIRHVSVNDENDVTDGVRDLGLDPIVVINGDNEYDDDEGYERPAWEAGNGPPHLCCGLAGRAEVLLACACHTGDDRWAHRAAVLVDQAIRTETASSRPHHDEGQPFSIAKGHVGLLAVHAQLQHPDTWGQALLLALVTGSSPIRPTLEPHMVRRCPSARAGDSHCSRPSPGRELSDQVGGVLVLNEELVNLVDDHGEPGHGQHKEDQHHEHDELDQASSGLSDFSESFPHHGSLPSFDDPKPDT